MAIPDFQSCMRPLLFSLVDGAVHSFNDAFEQVCAHFELSEADRNERLASGRQTIIRNRVGWATTYLMKAGLLERPKRSHLQITAEGQKVLGEQPERIDVRFLKQYEAFQAFHGVQQDNDQNEASQIQAEETSDPVERLEQAFGEIQNELADELLTTIKQQSPQFLETLVVDLMQAMGYGGWSKSSGQATQYTADGGIDGIINEDPLGLDTIYLQAKRYTNGTIGRPDIQAFVGALEMKRARKGVFITTSRFSADAQAYVGMIEKKIVLIDGQKLAELMIKHRLGVSTKEVYRVQALDSDYFPEAV